MSEINEALKAKEKYTTAVEEAYDYIEKFDLLETITNVGNDEVFTPRKVCEAMLDILPKEVWSNPNYKWLNPCTKNGIFEREIAIRLNEGLRDVIPDEETRKKHILKNMIYSIGLTKFTANVARRTLYYCCDASKKCDGIVADDGHYVNGYAIGNGTWFDTPEGNILTPITEHSFENGDKCSFCGINKDSLYNDPNQIEHYAYEFIHYNVDELQEKISERFFKGDKNMNFDIVIGNPPYQLNAEATSDTPIYNLFVGNAVRMNPKYLSMIIPARWMTGGKNLNSFRKEMIHDKHISKLYDYIDSKEIFPNNDIKGGVCYFLRERDYQGTCEIHTKEKDRNDVSNRFLANEEDDFYIRNKYLVSIKEKVVQKDFTHFFDIVSGANAYGLNSNVFSNYKALGLPSFSDVEIENGYKVYGLGEKQRRCWKYIPSDYPIPKITKCLNSFKVFIAKAYGCGAIGEGPSTPVLSTPGELCTQTFLEIGPFSTSKEAENVVKYIKSKFFRCMVGIIKQTQDANRRVYEYVPMQDFTDNSDINWNLSIADIDRQLYKKYKLSDEDIAFIEENIQVME